MIKKIYRINFQALVALIILFCTTSVQAAKEINPEDPYEPFNRVMFEFNDLLDRFILKPVATFYNKVIPKPLTKGLSNFYLNIDTVPTIANDLLQANFYQAVSDTWRLGINSTVGILGFFDVAERVGLEPNYEDFGLTLGRWGYTQSNYLVLPFMGPATVRDAIGFSVNYNLLSIYPWIRNPYSWRLYAGGVVVRRADILRYEKVLMQLSFDKYVFMRDAYLQHRNYLIERNGELDDPYLGKNKLERESESDSPKAASTEKKVTEMTMPVSDI